ncbi:hypothetical protein L9F63_024743, partial [Diploptera punctata]
MEVKPCNGESPLADPDTRREYDCGSGPNRQDCPSGSYCHQTPHFARCCKKDMSLNHKSCEDSWYGCCPDGKTAALGADNAGCPSMCGCNKLGSHSDTCDPITQQCSCKPGVGGMKCDRCEPGFWGLPKISEGYQGCIPCGCSLFGSVRDDCEQMTGRCVCKPGIQGQKCTVCTGINMILGPNGCVSANSSPVHPTLEFTACASHPCQRGGTCIDVLPGSFTCQCEPQWTGVQCEDPVVQRAYDIPAFDGRSYVQLKRLKAYSKLSIEVEFKTYANDGIILYNQQKQDGTGDFYVEFRYNLGNGPVVITSLDRVEMKKFHRVVAKRYHRDGILQLDDYEHVAGQSQGSLKALDLVEDAYVGYVPTNVTKVFENIGTNMGLMGCIRKLKIGRRLVELHEGQDVMVERVVGVRECGENPCSSLPCLHGATCRAIDSEKFHCSCTSEFIGELCEERVDPCLSHPCTDGSTCDALPQGGYVCKCPPGRKGKLCQDYVDNIDTDQPIKFTGETFYQYPNKVGKSSQVSELL